MVGSHRTSSVLGSLATSASVCRRCPAGPVIHGHFQATSMDTKKDSDEVKRVLAACFDDCISIYMDGRSPTVWPRTNEKNVISHTKQNPPLPHI